MKKIFLLLLFILSFRITNAQTSNRDSIKQLLQNDKQDTSRALHFLFLSHSIVANQKLIRFFGVVALLLVFEFINLYLHPYLAHATNDSPLLMLLVMVCIASMLVPVHHWLEKWITHQLVEKNKKIRLASAKKTIQQLEG